MELTVNGVKFHSDDFTFVDVDGDRTSSTMIGGGRDRAIELTIPRTLLAHAASRRSLRCSSMLFWGIRPMAACTRKWKFWPRSTQAPSTRYLRVFPEPKQDSWVLLDNEAGKVQIVDANYWVSAADGQIMGVTFHILARGNDTGFLAPRDLTVGDWTSSKQMWDNSCLMTSETRYFRITLHGGDGPAEGADYSQSVLNYYVSYNEGGIEELTATLDLSGLANQ